MWITISRTALQSTAGYFLETDRLLLTKIFLYHEITFRRKSKMEKTIHIIKHIQEMHTYFFLQKTDCMFYCHILKLTIEVFLLVKQHLSHLYIFYSCSGGGTLSPASGRAEERSCQICRSAKSPNSILFNFLSFFH